MSDGRRVENGAGASGRIRIARVVSQTVLRARALLCKASMMARSGVATACGLVAACSIGAACDSAQPAAPVDPGVAYLDDASYRRSDLVASLVNPANSYSALRLAHYATGTQDDWDLLPEWNPPAEPIAVTELDADGGAAPGALSDAAAPLTLPTSVQSADDPALLALGAQAFARYPAQLAPYFDAALSSRAAATSYGLWLDDGRGVGGLVRVRMGDGSVAVALTCSTCHAAPGADGAIAPGLPDHDLNIGAAILDAPGSGLDAVTANAIAAWGPGRLDVTTTAGTEPARIPDLRPVRWLTYLQQDATLRVVDATTLAIRIETLLITSSNEVVRPPRVIALALASYVASLGAGLPSPSVGAGVSPRGAAVFEAQCTGCHVPPTSPGPPFPFRSSAPTRPSVSRPCAGRGRTACLRSMASAREARSCTTAPFPRSNRCSTPRGRPRRSPQGCTESGAVPGHAYGLDLSSDDRAALVDYLDQL